MHVQLRSLEGVVRRHPEDGARRGVLRQRLVTVAPGGTGPRPPGTTTRTRGARCDRSGSNSGEGSAGPEPKIATVRAPGGERPPYGTQGASLGAWPAALRAGPTGASQAPDDSRRSATPSLGCVKRQSKTRAQKTRRGNEEVLLGARAFSSSFRPSRDSGEGRHP